MQIKKHLLLKILTIIYWGYELFDAYGLDFIVEAVTFEALGAMFENVEADNAVAFIHDAAEVKYIQAGKKEIN